MANRVQRVSAYAVISSDDKVLLCQLTRSKLWTLPGGGLEFGETPELAAVREVHEETGLTVRLNKLLHVHSFTKNITDDFHSIQIIYSASVLGGTLANEINGTTDLCQWVSLRDLDQLELVEMIGKNKSLLGLNNFP